MYLGSWAAAAPFFQGLGFLDTDHYHSSGYAISADGMIALAYSESDDVGTPFLWTQAGGVVNQLSDFPASGSIFSMGFGLSADGSVVAGYGSPSPDPQEACHWTGGAAPVGLGWLQAGSGSYGFGISADGSVIVGRADTDAGIEAFRWTQAGGIVGLGDFNGGVFDSSASAVSSDGTVIVGQGRIDATSWEAFRWTQAGGMVGLSDLPGGSLQSSAVAVSDDGSIVVGTGHTDTGNEAFRWTQAGGMVGIGFLPGGNDTSRARGISPDGTVIVGSSSGSSFVWTQADGMRDLYDILVDDYGLSLAGWTLTGAYDVSADGKVFVGRGTNPAGDTEAWVASIRLDDAVQIPEPATLTLLALGALALRRRKR